MKHSRIIFAFACLILLLVYGYRHRPDATFRKRLVGTWRYSRTESRSTLEPLPSDLTLTISANGDYFSQLTLPATHSIHGTAKVENGFLVLTATNRDSAYVYPPLVEHERIVQLNDTELATVPEGSNGTNHFQKLWPGGPKK
jgi:hypothetical protein